MIEILDIRYCRLGTADLDATVRFATAHIGLEEVGRENGTVYLRGDGRDHNIAYFQGAPDDHTLGLEVRDFDDLDRARSELSAQGLKVRRGSDAEAAARRCMGFMTFRDPSGNAIDLVVRPFASGRRYFPGRDAGIAGFSHVGLSTTDARRDEAFWTRTFNFRTHDWIGEAAFMSHDAAHHRIAQFPADGPGIRHVGFQVAEIDDVMRSWYYLTARQVPIRFGPGRHATSGAMFLYFEGPDRMTYTYASGARSVGEDWRPRQFPLRDESFCVWGARPDIPDISD